MTQSITKTRKSKKDHLLKLVVEQSFKQRLLEFVGDSNLSAFIRDAISEKLAKESSN